MNSNFGIGFSAGVSGIDTKSLDKAASTIKDYLERNTKLRKAFDLPSINTKGAEQALLSVNARVTELKKNIATISFNSGDGLKELDVSLSGGKLKVLGEARDAVTSLGNQLVNLKSDIMELSNQAKNGDESAKVRLVEMTRQLDVFRSKMQDSLGVDKSAAIEKTFGGAVLSIEQMQNKLGDVTGRIVTLQGEGQKVTKVIQTWNADTRKFETTSTNISSNYKEIQQEVDRLSAKLSSMFNKNMDSAFREQISGFSAELSQIDVYSTSAREQLDALTASVNTAKDTFATGKAQLSQYKSQLTQLKNAEFELYKLESDKNLLANKASRNIAIEEARKNVEVLKQQTAATRENLDALGRSTEATNLNAVADSNLTSRIAKLNDEQSKSTNIFKNFTAGMKDATARVLNYTIVYRALWSVVRLFRNSIQTTKDLDAAFTDIQMVLPQTGSSIETLQQQYADLAYEMSSSIVDVAKGADEWLRQGKSAQETAELLKASMVLSKVGAIQSAEATEYLTSVLNGYKLEAEDAMRVVDALSQVDVESASSVSDLAVALQRSANSAALAGVEFETLLGWIAEVKEVTQKSASSIGESFKRILSRMGSVKAGVFLDTDTEAEIQDLDKYINDTEKVLSKVGIRLRDTTNDFRDAEDVINDVAKAWKGYTDLEKNAIATAMAGAQQRENFVALMENYEKATELSTSALDSNGAAMEKCDIYQQSIAAGLERITALWQEFIINLNENGAIKYVIGLVEEFMKVLSQDSTATFVKWGTFPVIAAGAILKMAMSLGTLKKMTLAAKTATDALAIAQMKASITAAIFTAAIAAIIVIAQVLDELIVTTDELRNSLDETAESIKNTESELQSLNDQLKTANERIDELNAKDSLSLIEKDELDRLKETTRELRHQVILKEEQLAQDREKAYLDAQELYKRNSVQSNVKTNKQQNGYEYNMDGTTTPSYIEVAAFEDREVVLQENMDLLYSLNKQMEALNVNSETYAEDFKTLSDKIRDVTSQSVTISDDLFRIATAFNGTEMQGVSDELFKLIDSFEILSDTAENKFFYAFDNEKFSKVRSALLKLADTGVLSVEEMQKALQRTDTDLYEFMQLLDRLGFSIPDVVSAVYEFSDSLKETEEGAYRANIELTSYGTIIEQLSSKVDAVTKAQYEMNTVGILSAETVAALEKEYGNLNGIITLTEAGFITTNEALQNLLETERADYELVLNNARNAAISVLNAEGDKSASYKMTTEKIKEQLKAKEALLRADLALSQSQAVRNELRLSGGTYADLGLEDPAVTRERLNAVTNALKDIGTAEQNVKNFDQILSGLQSSAYKELVDKGSKGSKSTKKEETEFEKRIRILEHMLFLSQQISDAYEDNAEKSKEYLAELERQDDIYRQLQEATHEQAQALRKQGKVDTDKEIQELQQAWWGYEVERRNIAKETADYLDELNQKMLDQTEDILGKLKDAVNNLLDQAQMKLEDEQRIYDYRIKQLQATVSLTESYYDTMNSVKSEMKSINDELKISKQTYKYLDEDLRKTIFNDEDYAKLSKKLNGIAEDTRDIYAAYSEEINNLTDYDIYKVEEITNEFQRQYQLKQMEYGIVKAELNLVKAQTELQNTLANRNVRMFTGGEWVWTADYKAVESAMKNVAEAENDVQDQKVKMQQQKVIDNYNRMIDSIQLQSDAAENTYNEMERMWRRIEKSLELPAATINDVMVEIGESNLPMLQEIINKVSGSLSTLLNALGNTEKGANYGYGGSTSKNPLSGSNGKISSQQYLENKVAWQAAMDRGDTSTANKLHQINEQYRKDNGILTDKISSESAKNQLEAGVYDSGGILKGMGGIKATKKDEVVFDETLSAKMLNPEKSKSFLAMADGLSSILNNSDGISAFMKSVASGLVTGSQSSNSDSHDIYLSGDVLGHMSKSDSEAITSIIRRYIPITR